MINLWWERTWFLAVVLVCLGGSFAGWGAEEKPRLLILTDIGGDPDDQQSMIRLMTYANEFEIEGLIATASGTPGELKQALTKPHLIREIVEAYGKVRDNLAMHANGYPTADQLLECIKTGNAQRGLDAIGDGHDTEGSRWIVGTVDRPDPRKLNISIWGGQTDLAQALWRVRHDRGEAGVKQFQAKTRIYDIGDQDKIADWIIKEFPGLFYILPKPAPGEDRREAVYRGMYLGGDESLTSRAWVDENIRVDHGPLGALYPTRTWTAPNPHSTMKEGDTPSWFYFLPNGLSDPDHPEWGGWGGRFREVDAKWWRDAVDTVGQETHRRVTVWRWRPAFQDDFAARLDWCVKAKSKANHPPHAIINRDNSSSILRRPVQAGKFVVLDASDSTDPDGDNLVFHWWPYPVSGGDNGELQISSPRESRVQVRLPVGPIGQTYHLILEVRDEGTPALTRYRRVILVSRD